MPSLHTLHPFLRAARILVHPRPVARTKTVMTAVLAMIGMMGMLLAPTMQAQEFPSKPVRIIVTFTQGGAADITGRIFADRLADLWKQQVVVENRIGGGGSIGAEVVHKASPDGHTLLLATNTHIINHVLYSKLPFDYTRDFTAIGLTTSAPMMIAVNPDKVKARDLKEFTAMLKAAPGKYSYASCNIASPHHFAMEMYKSTMQLFAVHIPHRGCTPAVTDTVAGHLDIVATSVPAGLPFIKQGRLRAIALMSSTRTPAAPEIPTIRESGIAALKDFYLDNYYGFMAPPGTPPAVAAKIGADIRRLAETPDVRKKLEGAGLDMLLLGPTEMMKLIRDDATKYAAAARAADIKPE